MGESNRQKKFGRLVQKEISELLQQEVSIPGNPLVTVSIVRSSPDLTICKVFISVFPDEIGSATLDWLVENTWDVRQKLAKRVRHQMKLIPEILFLEDDTLSEAEKIEKLLEKVKKEDQVKDPEE